MNQQPHPTTWQSHHFRAMGSQIILWLDTDDIAQATEAFAQAQDLFVHNETVLSRFRPDSELMQLNARSGQWINVSDLLWHEVMLAVEMAWQTNGRFDPTLLNALAQAGYDQSFELITGKRNGRKLEPQALLGRWAEIELDESRQAVRLPTGVQLDLGGIAKGDTAQQAMELLQAFGACLVDAGGDLVAGLSPIGFPGWPVAISSPWTDSRDEMNDLATFWLAQGSLATSGVDYRSWVKDGCIAHHLIDPQTGSPAQTDALTATVWAKKAAAAEAWATATLLSGTDAGIEALLDYDLAGLVIGRDGRMLATPLMDQLLQGEPLLLA